MTSQAIAPPVRADSGGRETGRSVLLLGAPAAALLAGMAAEWLDFRELRVPLLLLVGLGVLATSAALTRDAPPRRAFLTAVATGMLTWAAVQCVYAVIHVAGGERFDADRFGPQWSQALALVAAHALFLGLPTGIVAGSVLWAARAWRRRKVAA